MTAHAPAHAPLVEVRRGRYLESIHYGSAVVTDARGKVLWQHGAPEAPTFLRSSAKPFQTLACLTVGTGERFDLSDEELALMCASHGAQPHHLQVVRSILAKCEMRPDDLGCGPHAPYHPHAAAELIRAGAEPARIHNNCSGKHAGMLAACRANGWDASNGYLKPDHPLQRQVRRVLAAYGNIREDDLPTATDGCGAPTFYMPLNAAATAFARLCGDGPFPLDTEALCRRVVGAIVGHPVLISQEQNYNALLVAEGKGRIIAKSGAEGLFCVGLPGKGVGMAIKVADGNQRAMPLIVLHMLQKFAPEAVTPGLVQFSTSPILNTRGESVGELRSLL